MSKNKNFEFVITIFIVIHILLFFGLRPKLNQTISSKTETNFNEDQLNQTFQTFQLTTINLPDLSDLNKSFKYTTSYSNNFKIISKSNINFTHVGGYLTIKSELLQCVDILVNYSKYLKYNVRVPKGIILEGPPGNGKTLLAKAFAGQTDSAFVSVSGSEFVEKYVGVGASRVRELFALALTNSPCIIFIDEIDAIGRSRGIDSSTNSERDTTLNELLVQLDGFDSSSGIFLIAATNKIEMLDSALIRPGRIDKKIHIPNPDKETRKEIINIHIKSKPYDISVSTDWLVETTGGLSGAQIENVLNEAMLLALRSSRKSMSLNDINEVVNREIGGFQASAHNFSSQTIDKIAIHEMGHAIVGLEAIDSYSMTKVILNWNSPSSPGYTVFDSEYKDIPSRQMLQSHLATLLAGRVSEEIFFDNSVTIGALNDLEKAFDISKKMITNYGLGSKLVYPIHSDESKKKLDQEIENIITDAYNYAYEIINKNKKLIRLCANKLIESKILYPEQIYQIKKEANI